MFEILKRVMVIVVSCALVAGALPRPKPVRAQLLPGKSSSDEAAALRRDRSVDSNRLMTYGLGYAMADTTDYEFPEEEEQRNLVKEVALWVIVAGFVAFFIIKVFLEGDTDEGQSGNGGKVVPVTDRQPVLQRK